MNKKYFAAIMGLLILAACSEDFLVKNQPDTINNTNLRTL